MTDLSPKMLRALQVLKLTACGYSDNEIGKQMYLAPDSIRTILKVFYKTIRANNRHHALAISIVNGWLTAADLSEALDNLRPELKEADDGTS